MKVLSVVGARPQFVKLSPVAQAFAAAGIAHTIVHTGQHYDANMSDAFFNDLSIPPADVHLGIGSGGHGVQTGAMLSALEPVLETHRPDWVLVYGDTNSTLAGAVAATKLHLPLAHLEAGLRSHNRLMPEEINRVLTDHASDLCLAPTRLSMDNLAAEGLVVRSVLVGDVMTDVCLLTRREVARNGLRPAILPEGDYVVATLHRAENTDDADRLAWLLSRLANLPVPVVLPVHPRLRDKAGSAGLSLESGSLLPVEPMGYPKMVATVAAAVGVVTDSGGLQRRPSCEDPVHHPPGRARVARDPEGGWNVLSPRGDDLAELLSREPTEPLDAHPYGDGHAPPGW